jgi:adenylate cyclase
LTRIGEGSEARVIDVPQGDVEIGRTEDAAICIAHPSLSRRHARIERRGGEATVVDLGSKNGTWVGGERVDRRALRDGDVLRLGDLDFAVSLGEGTAEPSMTVHIPAAAVSAAGIGRPSAGAEQRLRVLLEVGQVLSSPRPIEAVLESILELAFRVLDVDRGAILVPGPSGELGARIVRARTAIAEGQRIWSREIVEYVRRGGVAALFADARSDPRIDPTRSVLAQAIAASMAAPLKTSTADLGVLYVDSVRPGRRLSRDDLDLLAAFASQAAIALENSSLQGLQRFFPPSTLERIRAGGGRIPTVDTEVTALF